MKHVGRTAKRVGSLLASVFAVGALITVLSPPPGEAGHTTFAAGDLFVSVASGKVKWYRPDPSGTSVTFIHDLDTTLGGFTTGMGFDAGNNLYVTLFFTQKVSKFAPNGTLLGIFGDGYSCLPESILFDAAGNAYVGQAHPPGFSCPGGSAILKFDPAGNSLATIDVGGATDWIGLAVDQCTMFYTQEGTGIKAFNVCTNEALPDFVSGVLTKAFEFRLLPAGGVIVADRHTIRRITPPAAIVQTYDAPGEDCWFAMALDPDGKSFWSADFCTANVYKFDIATGAQLLTFNTGTGNFTVFGLAMNGEINTRLGPPPGGNACPLTQGYWESHPDAWPVSYLTLGSQTYTIAELLALLRTPVSKDASVNLAHQLIAAKLNIFSGSPAAPISSTIVHADSLLSGFTGKLPYGVKSQAMVTDARMLDKYNNGKLTDESACEDD